MGLYFERLVADSGSLVWHEGDEPAHVVVLSLDGGDPEWALLVEEWLASGVIVIATAAKTERFLVVEDRDENTQRLLRPFSPTRLREALGTAKVIRDEATVRAPLIDSSVLALAALAPEVEEVVPIALKVEPISAETPVEIPAEAEPHEELLDSLESLPEGDAATPQPEREISADVLIVDDEAMLSEALEIRIAETVADSVDELAALDSRDARVATLRYLIQTA